MMPVSRPRLLDLFAGAGGSAKGYQQAGFYVVGVDNRPQPHYCGDEFYQMDAFEFLETQDLTRFAAIHASPPCQRFSIGTPDRMKHPDLIAATRSALLETGRPYVIENVRHAPIRADVRICGCMVGLPLIRRVRHFETNPQIFQLMPPCQHFGPVITVTGHGTTTGNRNAWGRNISVREMREAMGIDWMNRNELSQAVPPAYTKWIGKQLIAILRGM